MNLDAARKLAVDLIAEHAPDLGIRFAWTRSKRKLGFYTYRDRILRLSTTMTAVRTEADVRETILHEIAHGIVGATIGWHVGHGPAWRAQARALGIPNPRSYTQVDAYTSRLAGGWQGLCAIHGWVGPVYFRQPTKTRSCTHCSPRFDARYRVTWARSSEGIAP